MRPLLLMSLLLLPLLLLGCPGVDDDDDSGVGDDDDSATAGLRDAFDLMAGLNTLECSGVTAADPSGTFTVGGLYGITVDADEQLIHFASNGGVQRTRTWDGDGDTVSGDADADEAVLITIVEEDGGLGEVRWDPGFGDVVTARYAPTGGQPVYSFIAQD